MSSAAYLLFYQRRSSQKIDMEAVISAATERLRREAMERAKEVEQKKANLPEGDVKDTLDGDEELPEYSPPKNALHEELHKRVSALHDSSVPFTQPIASDNTAGWQFEFALEDQANDSANSTQAVGTPTYMDDEGI
jgi:hypothetical protein